MFQKIYKCIFWMGYIAVLITTFLPIGGSLDKIRLGRGVFEIRLDHLLHLLVYFLICMYYLFGLWKGITLFEKNSFWKFVLFILLLGVITEVVQLWVPERTFNVFDLTSNLAGLTIGVGVIVLLQRRNGITA